MIACPPLYILRHGETEWNAGGRLQGHHDSTLTPLGQEQAAAQHAILSRVDLTGFQAISSPQARAYQTAQIALEGLIEPIQTDAALREIGLGDWAGENRAALIAQHDVRDGFDLYQLAPEGEGFANLYDRCHGFLARLTQPSVLVTHGITSRMLRLILTGQPIVKLRKISGGQGVVYQVSEGKQHRLTLRA